MRVTADDELAFPSYDGNGMFRSLGNILVNPAVALLFIDFERPNRLRVNGARPHPADDPLLADFPGAQFDGARARGAHLPQLPALHPPHADRRAFALCSARRAAPLPCRDGSAARRSGTTCPKRIDRQTIDQQKIDKRRVIASSFIY